MSLNSFLLIISYSAAFTIFSSCTQQNAIRLEAVSTVDGANSSLSEPFGVAVKGNDTYVSDGNNGKILRIAADGTVSDFASGLDTPSAITFAKNGDLIVADTGSHTVEAISPNGEISVLAGIKNSPGQTEGAKEIASFNGPTGVAVNDDGEIVVCDTYNDQIRIIGTDEVRKMAGSKRGFRDGYRDAQFDTPLGIAIWKDKVLVADAGNKRIRVIEKDGTVWTLAGSGEQALKDGPLLEASFVRPSAIAVNASGQVFIADGNAIRMIGVRGVFPYVITLSGGSRGFADGNVQTARFNRPSGIAFSPNGELLIADSENSLIRRIGSDSENPESEKFQLKLVTAEEFRILQPPRWPFDPPDAPRDIAGTLGELRGTVGSETPLRFHNGLDIAGQYGETVRFIRSEKVLDPISTENFGSSRELVRLPQIGYIHIRLGRDQNDRLFENSKFQPQFNADGKLADIRVRRGTKFEAGEPVGTLNAMNHVHLIAGQSGAEMNALHALQLPGISDSIAPTIETASVYDLNHVPVETKANSSRMKLAGKYRIVVRAFDRMDGNPERRKLGVYKLGYQIFRDDSTAASELKWTIVFDLMPPNAAAKFVYAEGSRSGATGETIFNYIVTNRLELGDFSPSFFDTADFVSGNYFVRVFAGDYFGNISTKDIPIEVIK